MTNTPPQDPVQFAKWLRAKAKRYTELANVLEEEFSAGGTLVELVPVSPQPNDKTITVEQLRGYVSAKSGRPADLAKHFGVTPQVILAAVHSADSGLVVAERGWVKLADVAANY